MFLYDYVLGLISNLEAKLSFSAFAAYMAYNFGASEYLLLLIQYLIVIDFFLGVFKAKHHKKFHWLRMWIGIKKVVSLYFGMLIVGVGCKAFDITLQKRIAIEYNGTFWFDLFLCVLILVNLASINHHLAEFGFGINQFLDRVFFKYRSRLQAKLEKKIDEALGEDNKS